jgi:Tfp pilus assembly protein PilF
LQAQRLLYPFPLVQDNSPISLVAPQASLEKALSLNPSLRQPYLLLGRIASLEGDYHTAQQHYRKRVALDMENPPASYNISGLILNWLEPQTQHDPATELLEIYQNWNARFPERAEGYLLTSLVVSQYQADPDRGRELLQAGVQANAQPTGLLLDALDTSWR